MKLFKTLSPRNILVFCTVAFMTSSCMVKNLEKNLRAEKHSIAYQSDYWVSPNKINATLAIDSLVMDSTLMPKESTVKSNGGYVIPLLVFNYWNFKYECTLGQSSIEEDIPSYLRYSFQENLEKSGIFTQTTPDKAEYLLEISIDKMKTAGPYKYSGVYYFLLYVYGYSYNFQFGPGQGNLEISCKLKKGNEIVLTRKFEASEITPKINQPINHLDLMAKNYAADMSVALSRQIIKISDEMVKELNEYAISNSLE